MNAPANRGKYAESAIQAYLKLLNDSHMNFTAARVPDAHAAGGRFTPQAGDFVAYGKTEGGSRNWLLEVKEVKHDFRLAHANYSADKVARVQKRVLAGSEALVLVYHSTSRLWRAVPFEVFNDRSTGGSWDLRSYPSTDYRTALSEFFGFLP